jgi:sugar phosphate permease
LSKWDDEAMRSLRLDQLRVIALLFAGYAALYFCRSDLSVGSPLITRR